MAQDNTTPINIGSVNPTIIGQQAQRSAAGAPTLATASSGAQARPAAASGASNRSIFLPRPQPGSPVYKDPKPMTWVSYSGQDIRAYIQVFGKLVWLANLYTLSYSSFRDIIPVRGMGQAGAIAHARGHRTVAGSMVFTQFNKEAFFDWLSYMGHDRNASGWYPVWVDQIPPFNLVVLCQGEVRRDVYAPEWGELIRSNVIQPESPQSRLIIYGVSLAGGGSTMSVDDMITEGVYNYHALGIAPLMDIHDGALAGSPGLTAEDGSRLIQEYKSAQAAAAPAEQAPAAKSSPAPGAKAQQPPSETEDEPPAKQPGVSSVGTPTAPKSGADEVPYEEDDPQVYNPGGAATADQVKGAQGQIKVEDGDGELRQLSKATAGQVTGALEQGTAAKASIEQGSREADLVTQAALIAVEGQGSANPGDKTPVELLVPRSDGGQLRVVASPSVEPGDAQHARSWIDSRYGQEVTVAGGRAIQPPTVTTLGQVTSSGGKTYDVHVVEA